MTPSTSKPAKLLTSLWIRLSCEGGWREGVGWGMPSRRESKEGRGEEAKPLTPDSHCNLKGYFDFFMRNKIIFLSTLHFLKMTVTKRIISCWCHVICVTGFYIKPGLYFEHSNGPSIIRRPVMRSTSVTFWWGASETQMTYAPYSPWMPQHLHKCKVCTQCLTLTYMLNQWCTDSHKHNIEVVSISGTPNRQYEHVLMFIWARDHCF